MSAPRAMPSRALSSSARTARAGVPTIKVLSGNPFPPVPSAPAPTRQLLPILAPLSTIAPMPIRLCEPMMQPCSITLWPMTQLSPITRGKPASVCRVELSWICERSPSSIHSLSPRSTAPNQTLVSDFSRTRPITLALSAIQQRPSAGSSGACPSSSKIAMHALPAKRARPCHGVDGLARLRLAGGNAERPECHYHHGARHQAPAAGDDGRDHHHAEAAPLDAAAADAVGHDDEGRREPQQRHRREGGGARAAMQQAEARRPRGDQLISARQQAGDGKADRQAEKLIDLLRRHAAPLKPRLRRSFAER